jgi:hypothetical protein
MGAACEGPLAATVRPIATTDAARSDEMRIKQLRFYDGTQAIARRRNFTAVA